MIPKTVITAPAIVRKMPATKNRVSSEAGMMGVGTEEYIQNPSRNPIPKARQVSPIAKTTAWARLLANGFSLDSVQDKPDHALRNTLLKHAGTEQNR